MKLTEFVKRYTNVQIIDSSTFSLLDEDPQKIRCQVRYWVKQGYLIILKRGIYILDESLRKYPLSMGFIANFLVSPSYLSTEYALSYYDLIPEKTTVYTSITTKKTSIFKTQIGVFEYRSVKSALFFGFIKKTEAGSSYFIAYPEKALLDFFYLNRYKIKNHNEAFELYRFQNLNALNLKRFDTFRLMYDSRTNTIARNFIVYARSQKKRYTLLK